MTPGSAAVRPDPGPDVADRARSATQFFEQVARQACRSAHVDGAVVSAIDDGEGLLRVIAAEGDSALPSGRLLGGDRGLTARACELGEPIVAAPGEDLGPSDPQRLPGGLPAVAAGPIWADGRVWGALTMLAADPVDAQRDELLRDLGDLTALASAAVQAAAEVRRETLHAGVSAFGSLLDLRDGYTSDHTAAVADLCGAIGRHMELGPAELDALDSAARLHDLGKIGVPDHILHKPSSLTGDEWDVVRCHPGWGAAALQRIPGFAAVAQAVRGHHERWDGEGYPDGVAGQEIPLASRVITVSDAYHAMTSNRPYRSALDEEKAMRRMRDGAGSQFDPGVIEALDGARAIDTMPRDRECAPLMSSPSPSPLPPDGAVKAGRFVRAEQPRRGGKALAEALARATRLPALTESRDRVLGLLDAPAPDPRRVIAVIESEIALTVAVLRAAARIAGAGEVTSVPGAVRRLGTAGLVTAVQEVPTIGFFQHLPGITMPAEHFRLHALATKRAADRLASTLIRDDRDEILIGALLHDVGKMVLGQAYGAYPDQILAGARTPDERLDAERRHLHMDHAALGGVLLRRWELPERLITTVERHHDPDATGPAAIVRLADMLAHYTHARPVDPRAMLSAGRHLALDPTQLRVIMFDLSQPAAGAPRATHPSPLTAQEQAVLHHLATGKVYKEIGVELGIAASTVRSHCHAVYRKLDVSDRANAVLTATDNGWI